MVDEELRVCIIDESINRFRAMASEEIDSGRIRVTILEGCPEFIVEAAHDMILQAATISKIAYLAKWN